MWPRLSFFFFFSHFLISQRRTKKLFFVMNRPRNEVKWSEVKWSEVSAAKKGQPRSKRHNEISVENIGRKQKWKVKSWKKGEVSTKHEGRIITKQNKIKLFTMIRAWSWVSLAGGATLCSLLSTVPFFKQKKGNNLAKQMVKTCMLLTFFRPWSG